MRRFLVFLALVIACGILSKDGLAASSCGTSQRNADSSSAWPPDCTTNLFPDSGTPYRLNWLGSYEHVLKSSDHLMSVNVFDADRLFLVSGNGVVVTGRNPVNQVLPQYALFKSDHTLPSNLDGATNLNFYAQKFFNSAVYGSYVYVTTRYDPIYAFQVTGSGSGTTIQRKWMAPKSRTFTENLQVVNGKLFAVHHADGVEVFDLANPASPVSVATLKLTDSWNLAVRSDGNMLIADGAAGVQWLRYNDAAHKLQRASGDTLQTSPGVVLDVAMVGTNTALAAVAGAGVTTYYFNPKDPDPAHRLSRLATTALPGMCMDVEPMDANQAVVACRTWVHVVAVDPASGAVTVIASAQMHRRLGRPPYRGFPSTNIALHVTVSGDKIYVAAWDHVDMYQLVSSVNIPDLRLSTHRVHFAAGTGTATVTVANGGTAPLAISAVGQSTSSDIRCSLDSTTLAPGASATLTVSYDGLAPVQDDVGCSIQSNDPDDGSLSKSSVAIPIYAAMPAYVDPGEVPPEFFGNAVLRDYGTGIVNTSWFDLANYLDPGQTGDRVVHFAVWASW
ncbi:MAG: hypothetical protein H0X25_16095 [Acidobacteriales bacterium]|nr:hypothetical protein [Terriglobales bacterium]